MQEPGDRVHLSVERRQKKVSMNHIVDTSKQICKSILTQDVE